MGTDARSGASYQACFVLKHSKGSRRDNFSRIEVNVDDFYLVQQKIRHVFKMDDTAREETR
jgi:hypothetical protein